MRKKFYDLDGYIVEVRLYRTAIGMRRAIKRYCRWKYTVPPRDTPVATTVTWENDKRHHAVVFLAEDYVDVHYLAHEAVHVALDILRKKRWSPMYSEDCEEELARYVDDLVEKFFILTNEK